MEHVAGRSCGHVHVSKYHTTENSVHAKQLLKQFFEFLVLNQCPTPCRLSSFRPSPWLSSYNGLIWPCFGQQRIERKEHQPAKTKFGIVRDLNLDPGLLLWGG